RQRLADGLQLPGRGLVLVAAHQGVQRLAGGQVDRIVIVGTTFVAHQRAVGPLSAAEEVAKLLGLFQHIGRGRGQGVDRLYQRGRGSQGGGQARRQRRRA